MNEAQSLEKLQQVIGRHLEEQNALADIAETVSPVMHALGNLVNNMVLEASVLQAKGPPELGPGLQNIRDTGRRIAELLQQYADFRYSKYPQGYPVDLNGVISQTLVQMNLANLPVRVQLDEGLPSIAASIIQINHLVRLLVANALRVSGPEQKISLRTQHSKDGVMLTVQDSGPNFSADVDLAERFEPLGPVREGENSFELAACKGIVRRLKGTMEMINGNDKGTRTLIVFPVSQ